MSLPKPYYEDTEHGIVIYHADCRDILPHLPRVDLLLTDPPYGIAFQSSHKVATTTASWVGTQIQNDESTAARDEALCLVDEWCCFGTHKAPFPEAYRFLAVWDKGPASGMGDLSIPFKPSFELVFCSGEKWSGSRDEGVIKGFTIVTRASMGRVHPNEKPVGLIKFLLNKHQSQTVLDPFMGSGTTLVACKQLGRHCIGIEIEESYCEIAAKRLSQGMLFGQEELAQIGGGK